MARNLIKELTTIAAVDLVPDHPSITAAGAQVKAGDPFRFGRMVFFALINEQFGYESGGYRAATGINPPRNPIAPRGTVGGAVPGSAQYNIWQADVYNDDAANDAPAGTPVYYVDTADGPSGDLNYHLVVGVVAAVDAYCGVLMEAIGSGTKKSVQILVGAGQNVWGEARTPEALA